VARQILDVHFHGVETVAASRIEVLFELDLVEELGDVVLEDEIGRLAGVDALQDGDEAAHYFGVAVGYEVEPESVVLSLKRSAEPDAALTAAKANSFAVVVVLEGRQVFTQLDEVEVTLFPGGEMVESADQFINGSSRIVLCVCVHNDPPLVAKV
jgi:hypothetical protein